MKFGYGQILLFAALTAPISGCAVQIFTPSTVASHGGPTSGLTLAPNSQGQPSVLLGVGVTAPVFSPATVATGAVVQFTISPSLPIGLTMDTKTGAISGIASHASANTSYVVSAVDAAGATASTTFNLRVMDPGHQFSSGYSNLMYLRPNGSIWAWGEANGGRNGTAETITPQPSQYALPPEVAAHVTQVSAADTSCVLIDDTIIRCTGANDKGQVGCASCGDGVDRYAFMDVQPPSGGWGASLHVRQISSGPYHACAIVDEGGVLGKIYCWGHNEAGQLGLGTADNVVHATPDYVRVLGGMALTGATALSVGNDTTCAVALGSAYCWGSNNQSQIGSAAASDPQLTPMVPTGLTSGVTEISTATYFDYANSKHTCAIVNGGAKCWGSNYFKQIGNPAAVDPQVTPLDVTGLSSGAEMIRAQAGSSCAIQAGELYCWGNQDKGHLFNQSSDASAGAGQVTPFAANLGAKVVSFAMGEFHTCALLVTGEMKCVGSNYAGMHGTGAVDAGGWPGLDHLTPSTCLDSFF